MTDQIDRVRVPSDGFTLPGFLWSLDKTPTAGRVEAVLKLNPGLASTVFLQEGAEIRIPKAESSEPTAQPLISLWE